MYSIEAEFIGRVVAEYGPCESLLVDCNERLKTRYISDQGRCYR